MSGWFYLVAAAVLNARFIARLALAPTAIGLRVAFPDPVPVAVRACWSITTCPTEQRFALRPDPHDRLADAAALLMGLAGCCTARRCGAACTAVATRRGRASSRLARFHAGRLFGYTAGGALAAASGGAVAGWMQSAPALRPLWVLAHLAALSFGLWLAFAGRQPAWLAGLGAAPRLATAGAGWQPLRGPLVATATGGAWIALPCGLLQSALLVAVLAGDALGGAAVWPPLRSLVARPAARGHDLSPRAARARRAALGGAAVGPAAGGRIGLGARPRPVAARGGLLFRMSADPT
jgi:hypothetical protein